MLKTFLFILSIQFFVSYSQNEQKFYFGINVGGKFANKNYAQRYAGIYPNNGSSTKLESTLYQPQNYDRIYALLGDYNFQVPFDAYPTNIRYSPGILTGVTMGYQLSPTLQIGIDADFCKLKVKDFYTIEVIDPGNQTTQGQFQVGNLYAEESRFNARFNFDYIIEGESVNFLIGASGIFSAWRVDEHLAVFRDYIMPMHSVHDPNNNFTVKTTGNGFGAGLNAGAEYRLNEKIVLQLMYQPYFQRTDYFNTKSTIEALGSSYVKDRYRLEHDLTLRILWK
ncbi:MAG: hypothetical protein ABJG68_16770 [Crocinitomicaceae bacterium]